MPISDGRFVTPMRIFARSQICESSTAAARPKSRPHISGPWRAGGPDVVQNGIALSGTAHWLFDRHLISLTDDYRLLVSHNKVPKELQGLFARQLDRVHLPSDPRLWPYPAYIARHREAFISA